jgi:hypothetical protein
MNARGPKDLHVFVVDWDVSFFVGPGQYHTAVAGGWSIGIQTR